MISRRRFVATSTAAIFVAPLTAEPQQVGKVYRIGHLGIRTPNTPEAVRIWDAFRQELNKLGWVEGQNLTIELRHSEGVVDRFPELAAELVRLKVDVITTASGGSAVRAAMRATTTTPIVMLSISDPVAFGFVASLARPGGNVTGIADLSSNLTVKRLELLKETLPRVVRVVHLGASGAGEVAWSAGMRSEQIALAKSLGISLRDIDVKNLQDFAQASAAIVRERPDALLLRPHPLLFQLRTQIAEFALTHRLPAVAAFREVAIAGTVMSYGPDLAANFKRGAAFVDKIFRGAKPADLPVEQPTKLDLVINLKTAKALGLTIPPSVLVRAVEVIE